MLIWQLRILLIFMWQSKMFWFVFDAMINYYFIVFITLHCCLKTFKRTLWRLEVNGHVSSMVVGDVEINLHMFQEVHLILLTLTSASVYGDDHLLSPTESPAKSNNFIVHKWNAILLEFLFSSFKASLSRRSNNLNWICSKTGNKHHSTIQCLKYIKHLNEQMNNFTTQFLRQYVQK